MFGRALKQRGDDSIVVRGAQPTRVGALRHVTEEFGGQRVAVCIDDVATLVEVVIALDRVASAVFLIPSNTTASRLDEMVDAAGIDSVISEHLSVPGVRAPSDVLTSVDERRGDVDTNWLFTTSGTTGTPKVIEHSAGSLTRSISDREVGGRWGLLYDLTRFAGFQVVLQALTRGGSLIVASTIDAPFSDKVQRLIDGGCTHLSASPSMWRRLLMHPRHHELALVQVTLGGEAADQQILSALTQAFPAARITHIYASTESGVVFSVSDGMAGFPVSLVSRPDSDVQLKIVDGRLWIRSAESGVRNVGPELIAQDADGFIDTQDRVEVEGERAYFRGRANDVVVVGGTNVDLADVQSALLAHGSVAAAAVRGEPSPMTGSIVVADVVRVSDCISSDAELRRELRLHCRASLPREAVPAKLRIVDEIELTSAGKVKRN